MPLATVLIFALLVGFVHCVAAQTTALDDYVAEPDPSYRFVHYDTETGSGYTTCFLKMTSQKWRSREEVDRVLWERELLIAVPWVPHSGNQQTAFLLVNGGRNKDWLKSEDNEVIGLLAVVTGAVTALGRCRLTPASG